MDAEGRAMQEQLPRGELKLISFVITKRKE